MLKKLKNLEDFVIGQNFFIYCDSCDIMRNIPLFGISKEHLSFNCEHCKDIIIYEKKVFGYK